MDALTFYQNYWWFLISLLGGLLVFLLFVQGGQGMLYYLGRTPEERNMIVNSLGRKWEFAFTTLVTFGGAFFASFPLFYSTSFGGAFYVWMLILFCFVIQAVAYEYRRKPGNVFGMKTYEIFLMINGVAGPLLLGTAVGTLFTGANFTVDRFNMADLGGNTTISQWTTAWHGLEAVLSPALLLGVAVALLAILLGCHYLLNNVADDTVRERARRFSGFFAPGFLLFFLTWLIQMLEGKGYAVDPVTQVVSVEPMKYLHNLLEMPAVAALLLIGVVLVLWGLLKGWKGCRSAIWFSGAGTVLTVLALLLLAGWNNTAYYPSLADLQSSLTIRNSSSSLFTLKAMSIVSLLIPFVLAYIWYAWRSINREPVTHEELRGDDHAY